jgi:hypothetical protein
MSDRTYCYHSSLITRNSSLVFGGTDWADEKRTRRHPICFILLRSFLRLVGATREIKISTGRCIYPGI